MAARPCRETDLAFPRSVPGDGPPKDASPTGEQDGAARAAGKSAGPRGVGSQAPPLHRAGVSSDIDGAWARRRAALVADGELLRSGATAAMPERPGWVSDFTQGFSADLNGIEEQPVQSSTYVSLSSPSTNPECKTQ